MKLKAAVITILYLCSVNIRPAKAFMPAVSIIFSLIFIIHSLFNTLGKRYEAEQNDDAEKADDDAHNHLSPYHSETHAYA